MLKVKSALYSLPLDYTLHDAAMEAGIVDYLLVILTSQLKHNENNTTSNAVSIILLCNNSTCY